MKPYSSCTIAWNGLRCSMGRYQLTPEVIKCKNRPLHNRTSDQLYLTVTRAIDAGMKNFPKHIISLNLFHFQYQPQYVPWKTRYDIIIMKNVVMMLSTLACVNAPSAMSALPSSFIKWSGWLPTEEGAHGPWWAVTQALWGMTRYLLTRYLKEWGRVSEVSHTLTRATISCHNG